MSKAAEDNGFDVGLPRQGDWLPFASSGAPVRVWLRAYGEDVFLVALSQPNVWRALSEYVSFPSPLPDGAYGARGATQLPALHKLLLRAFRLSRTLPDALHQQFVAKTANLPRSTEAERLTIQRVGQDLFRAGLLDYWDGRCAISGLAVPELVRASHIKPWADANDEERLDVYNGLLLAAHLDAAFDAALISVADDGVVLVSAGLDAEARAILGLDRPRKVRVAEGHRGYLAWHRAVFEARGALG